MKKLLGLIACLVSFCCLSACARQVSSSHSQETKPVVAVTTTFLADIVQQIANDLVTVETLIPAGEDPHVYLAKASDLQKLSQADLVLYHGLHFEGKMIEALEQTGIAVSTDFPLDRLIHFDEEGSEVVDPHFWFDLSLYKLAVETVASELKKLVPEQATAFEQATATYLLQLDELDRWIQTELAAIPLEKRYLITPHDAFNYFARAYQFHIHAPQGVSTDSEVANKDMIETVELIVDKHIPAIFSESTTNPERMEKLKEAVLAKGQTVEVVAGEGQELYSDSLAPQGHSGDTFITMYQHNIQLIVEHLK